MIIMSYWKSLLFQSHPLNSQYFNFMAYSKMFLLFEMKFFFLKDHYEC